MKPRILSIGLQLESDQITNGDFMEAPSFHDFDVVLIDPSAVMNFFHREMELFEVKDGFVTINYDATGTNKLTKQVIKKRKKETGRFLNLGRSLVCVLRAPSIVYLCSHIYDQPDRSKPDNWVSSYDWLPLKYSEDSMTSILPSARGNKINLSAPKDPFAPYFKAFDKQLYYEAYLDEEEMPSYFENLYTIAESHGQLPVAFSFKLEGGRVVFLPPIENPDPEKLADVLLNCISATIGTIEETEPPSWLQSYKASVPGLPELEHQEEMLNTDLQELNTRLTRVQQEKAEKEKYLKLLYEQGKFQLEPVVRDAFSLLGFDVKGAEPSDGLLESHEGVALLEVEGKDDNAIKIDKYRQLLNYVVDDEQQTGQLKKGILVGNGFRLKDPRERGEQFTQKVVDGAAGSHFCLITTDTLFHLVCQVLEKPDDHELKSQIRKQLLTTDGLFRLETESNH